MLVDCEHRSYQDSLARAASLGGADLIFTSPPYPDARPGQYGGEASHDFTWADYQALGDAVFAGLRPGGFCGVVIDGPVRMWRSKAIGSERSLIAFKLAIDWAERVGLRYVEHCAFGRTGTPGRFGDRWVNGWEPIHVFQRPGGRSLFDVTAYTIPSLHPGVVNYKGRYRSNVCAGREKLNQTRVTAAEKSLSTLLACGGVGGRGSSEQHPAPFPGWLADAFVACYARPDSLVCDPFVGSGTVAVSAAKAGRRFVGGDLGARESDSRKWAEIARERAEAACSISDIAGGASKDGQAMQAGVR